MDTPIGDNYPILTGHIDVEHGFEEAFGGFGQIVERAAHVVMSFLIDRDKGWEPFRDEDIQQYFRNHRPNSTTRSKRFAYRRSLCAKGFLQVNDQEIRVTHELVALCFHMSPYLVDGAPQERKSST